MAAAAVIAHEEQHVQHNAQEAAREGMKATSTVQIHSAVCPECGRIYVSGGTTTTTYAPKQQYNYPGSDATGLLVNKTA
jgi:hypothetical protein